MAEAYPWQQALWQQLAGRSQHAHAYLLHGPQGIGKRALAERLMARLLCQQPQGLNACGGCKSCLLLKAGSHPDNFVLEPEEADKPIKVDQVRELVAFVVQTAQLGGRKVVLIEPVEAMNVNASNALLKSLEEPSGDTVLLLVTHQPSRLLPTIKSRCRQFPLTAPAADVALAWLQQQGMANAASELAFHGGMPVFVHDAELAAVRDDFIASLTQLGMGSVLSAMEKLDRHKLPLAVPLSWLGKWLHDLASLKLAGMVRYYPDRQPALERLLPRLDLAQLMHCQRELNLLLPFGQHTLVTRLQLEALLMHYLKVISGKN